MRQAADDFAAKLQKTIRVQLIKIPKKVRRRVRARPARRRASHFVTSPVRGSELTDSIPPQVRVLSLEQFSEDIGRDVSKELLANINLRAGLPADANGAEATTADETVRPPSSSSARIRRASLPPFHPPGRRRVSAAFHAPGARRTSLPDLERSPERPISPSPATFSQQMPPPSSARGRRGRGAEPTTAATTTAATAAAAKKRGRPAIAPPPAFDAAPAPESTSTRRSARHGGGAEGTSGATTTAAAAAGGCFFAETPAAKKTRRASDVAGVPCTPRGAGAPLGHVGGMAVACTPGTVRGPRRGEVLYSKNGSPIGAVEDSDDERAAGAPPPSSVKKVTMTASKARRPGRKGKTPADDDIGLVLTTDDGKEIDIAAVGADGGAEEVEATMGMLAKMQAQVAAHMARLAAAKR